MFPPNLSIVDYNDDGKAAGWSVPSDDPPEPDAEDECDGADRPGGEVCRYSAKHAMDGVPATRVIDCGPVAGAVPACEACAVFYEKLGRR